MYKRLYRSRSNFIISGACGGVGQYLEIDPTLVRIVFVLLTLVGGIGVLLYVALWTIVPLEPRLEDILDEIDKRGMETAKVVEKTPIR